MKNNVQLIAYVDRFSGGSINTLRNLINSEFNECFSGIHLLPFYNPIDGEDAGFDPIDHTSVDERLGSWQDIKNLAEGHEVMADMIVNHVSAQSPMFQDYLENGKASAYAKLFLTMDSIFPNGATEADLLTIYRPRPGLPFSYYSLKDGSKVLMWTSFTKNQIDIDVQHDLGWQYLMNILNTFEKNNIAAIRLDATGYAIKKAGTSCFMLPETFEFIDKLKQEANNRGIEVLVEIHSHHATQIEIAKHSDYVYDFALPPLILHTLTKANSKALVNWLEKAPRNAITVLDTHDGIGIIDAGASRPGTGDGLLNENELDALVNKIHENSQGGSRLATGAAASNIDLYQVNCTFYDALGRDDHCYLLARLIQFFCPGIPQVYYVGLLAGENDTELLKKTDVGRDINRRYYDVNSVKERCQSQCVQNLLAIIRFRNRQPAFDGEYSVAANDPGQLFMKFESQNCMVSLQVDLTTAAFEVVSKEQGKTEIYGEWSDF